MIWRTDKPTEKVIVAKLTEDFCHQKDSYAILRLANEPYQHYSDDGEEIPYASIEKWASLEEEKLPEGLEEAAERYADMNCHNYIDHESDRNELFYSFKAGANWRAMHSSKLPDNLNQAAEEYAYTNWEDNDYHEGASEGLPFDAIGHTEKCFIAGAEWQKEKDQQLIELAEDHAMLAGMNKMKEEMMEGAVEIGTTELYWESDGDGAFPTFDPPVEDLLMPSIISQKFNDGDKVKVIIVK